ncbi:hypothetical protein C8J57DRAFT_1476284 [Mycena rebaudengoi]|nr:hypothetical protein C8J57DRAFT_1476284 [Mycena rebaudengoi]
MMTTRRVAEAQKSVDEKTEEILEKSFFKLGEAIQMLPSSSPYLHTLLLKLDLSCWEDMFPWEAFEDLIAALNGIHLPSLVSFDLSIDIKWSGDEENDDVPSPSFTPFLTAHPQLLHLKLALPGKLPVYDAACLPCLRSFTGPFIHCASVVAHKRALKTLCIILTHSPSFLFDSDFRPENFPSTIHSSLTKLQVWHDATAVETYPWCQKFSGLCPKSLFVLVSAFPDIVHLDICLKGKIKDYRDSLTALSKLNYLRIQQYRVAETYERYLDKKPASDLFPAEEYISEINALLPSHSQLSTIDIRVIGDVVPWGQLSCCGEDLMWAPHELWLRYRFSVLRTAGDAQAVLLQSTGSKTSNHILFQRKGAECFLKSTQDTRVLPNNRVIQLVALIKVAGVRKDRREKVYFPMFSCNVITKHRHLEGLGTFALHIHQNVPDAPWTRPLPGGTISP